ATCKRGKIRETVNWPTQIRAIRAGDAMKISRPLGRKQQIGTRRLENHHIAKAEARQLYEDRTPPPTAEEIEMRKIERMHRAAITPPRAPDKRARRAIRKMKEGG